MQVHILIINSPFFFLLKYSPRKNKVYSKRHFYRYKKIKAYGYCNFKFMMMPVLYQISKVIFEVNVTKSYSTQNIKIYQCLKK